MPLILIETPVYIYVLLCRTHFLTDPPRSLLFLLLFFVCQVTGKCGSVRVRLIPAPRGTGLVAAPVPKKLLSMVRIDDNLFVSFLD